MDDILTTSINGSGYNSKYGLLGSNRATEDKVKLFPEKGEELVNDIQKELNELEFNGFLIKENNKYRLFLWINIS